MFTKIKNPKTGQNVSIFTKQGKDILKNYTITTKKSSGG